MRCVAWQLKEAANALKLRWEKLFKKPPQLEPPTVSAKTAESLTFTFTMPKEDAAITDLKVIVVPLDEADQYTDLRLRAAQHWTVVPRDCWEGKPPGSQFEWKQNGLNPMTQYAVKVHACGSPDECKPAKGPNAPKNDWLINPMTQTLQKMETSQLQALMDRLTSYDVRVTTRLDSARSDLSALEDGEVDGASLKETKVIGALTRLIRRWRQESAVVEAAADEMKCEQLSELLERAEKLSERWCDIWHTYSSAGEHAEPQPSSPMPMANPSSPAAQNDSTMNDSTEEAAQDEGSAQLQKDAEAFKSEVGALHSQAEDLDIERCVTTVRELLTSFERRRQHGLWTTPDLRLTGLRPAMRKLRLLDLTLFTSVQKATVEEHDLVGRAQELEKHWGDEVIKSRPQKCKAPEVIDAAEDSLLLELTVPKAQTSIVAFEVKAELADAVGEESQTPGIVRIENDQLWSGKLEDEKFTWLLANLEPGTSWLITYRACGTDECWHRAGVFSPPAEPPPKTLSSISQQQSAELNPVDINDAGSDVRCRL